MAATLQSNIPKLIEQMRSRGSRLVRKTAAGIKDDIKSGMAEPKTGRSYGPGDETSAPGESPAIDKGTYAASIQTAQVDETTAAVGTNDARGLALELGGAKIAARPHFGPAFERAEEEFQQGLGEIFE